MSQDNVNVTVCNNIGSMRFDRETEKLINELRIKRIEIEMQQKELNESYKKNEQDIGHIIEQYGLLPIGYFVVNSNGNIINVNSTGARFFELARIHMIGEQLTNFLFNNDKITFQACLDKAFLEQTKQTCEITMLGKYGELDTDSFTTLQIEITANLITQICKLIVTDITKKKYAEKAFNLLETSISSICKNAMEKISGFGSWGYNTSYEDNIDYIPEEGLPGEMHTVIQTLNTLIKYVNERSMRERFFAAYASHELRTPLGSIRLQTEIAIKTKDIKLRNEAHTHILNTVDRSTLVLEQLIELSRLNKTQIVNKFKRNSLSTIINEVINDLTCLVREKKLVIDFKYKGMMVISCCADTLCIALNNLIRNAIFHAPEGSKILLHLRRKGQQVILNIIDTGPGIQGDKRKFLLEFFQKAEETDEQLQCGLGLIITKYVIDIHNGTIRLKEEESGGGLNIEITIPQCVLN